MHDASSNLQPPASKKHHAPHSFRQTWSLEQVLERTTSSLHTLLCPLLERHAGPVDVGRSEGIHGGVDPVLQLLEGHRLGGHKNLCLEVSKDSII